MKKTALGHLQKLGHRYHNKGMPPDSSAPLLAPEARGRDFHSPQFLALFAAVLLLGAAFFYYFILRNPQTDTESTPSRQIAPGYLPVEIARGQVTSLEGDTLTLKDQQIKIKISSQSAIYKQKKLNAYTIGVIPAEIKVSDQVSIEAVKNGNEGELLATMVVIRDETVEKISTISAKPQGGAAQ